MTVASSSAALHSPAMRATLLAVLLVSCASAPALPEATGRGLLQCDSTPPAGATTWSRPTWRVGDRFVLVRGEKLRGEFTVTAATATHYALDAGNGVAIRRDLDLGNLGEWRAEGEPLHVLSPVDTRYHWPLWVGKRWSCEYVDRSPGGPGLALRADYLVEDLDTVTVPAGTFQALRITRHLALVGVDEALTRWQVSWYAPAAGIEVRQLYGDTLVELAELPAQR